MRPALASFVRRIRVFCRALPEGLLELQRSVPASTGDEHVVAGDFEGAFDARTRVSGARRRSTGGVVKPLTRFTAAYSRRSRHCTCTSASGTHPAAMRGPR